MYSLRTIVPSLRSFLIGSSNNSNNVSNGIRFGVTQVDYLKEESDTIIRELCQDDAEKENKFRLSMLEIEVLRRNGEKVPEALNLHHWKRLMLLHTKKQRREYLLFLFKIEKKNENRQAKKEAEQKERLATKKTKEYPDDHSYGLGDQNLFLRIYPKSMDNYYNYRSLQMVLHSQPTVIDCSYEEHMVYREIKNAAEQIKHLFHDNRTHREPLNLHLYNVNRTGVFMEELRKRIPNIEKPYHPLSTHTEDFMDIFPKDKLIYLSPHCDTELKTFNHDAIYIVGCMVDKARQTPISLAKAKKKGIKMAKLPLDKYLEFAPSSRRILNINHMISILADIRLTGDWKYSLRHVPRRLLMEYKLNVIQKQLAYGDLVQRNNELELSNNIRSPPKNTMLQEARPKFYT